MTQLRRRGFVLAGLACLIPVQAAALTVFVAENGQVIGPFDADALKARLGSRTQAAVTQVWMQGMPDWAPANQVPALSALVASLPLDPPFDAAKYVIGSWTSDTQPIETQNDAIVGRVFFAFADDGTFTAHKSGSLLRTIRKPGRKPGAFTIEAESYVLNFAIKGKFSVRSGKDGYFEIWMKGKSTDKSTGAKGKIRDWQDSVEFKQAGPNHMRTRYGVDYYKAGG